MTRSPASVAGRNGCISGWYFRDGGRLECDLSVGVFNARDIEDELFDIWEEIVSTNDALGGPHFSSGFIKVIRSIRDDLHIAVISSENGQILAFFPFLRGTDERGNAIGLPPADILSDWAALICIPGFGCEPLELVRQCGLSEYRLLRFLHSQEMFSGYFNNVEKSGLIDLSDGFEAYLDDKRRQGSGLEKNCAYCARRMERELGPMRFVPHSGDLSLFEQILSLKSLQYKRTGRPDFVSIPWIREYLARVNAEEGPLFFGSMSALYAGEHLVAGHIGMRSRTVWQYQLPAYDIRFAKYSPGSILLMRMAEYAPKIGIRVIDIGRVREIYKARCMNNYVLVADGLVA